MSEPNAALDVAGIMEIIVFGSERTFSWENEKNTEGIVLGRDLDVMFVLHSGVCPFFDMVGFFYCLVVCKRSLFTYIFLDAYDADYDSLQFVNITPSM